jgi:hypothetical protein
MTIVKNLTGWLIENMVPLQYAKDFLFEAFRATMFVSLSTESVWMPVMQLG